MYTGYLKTDPTSRDTLAIQEAEDITRDRLLQGTTHTHTNTHTHTHTHTDTHAHTHTYTHTHTHTHTYAHTHCKIFPLVFHGWKQ